MDHLGEKHLHQKHHDQHNPPMGCWCKGATNLEDVNCLQQLLDLLEERVEKVIDRKLKLLLNSSSVPHQAESYVSRSLQLRFKGELPETILTKNNIEDVGVSLELELCNDAGERAEDISPELKNLKVKILPLVGDFKVEDRHDWTQEEFENHVAIPRDDKPPLLKGNSEISLNNGVARIHGISFMDNSSYMRSRKFRLGAQLVKGLSSGVSVRPAVSEAFQVKEQRLKAYQKNPIPLPNDKLWRLVNIKNPGPVYQRAVKQNILTVLDFLQLYYTDARKLQDILQLKGKNWKETVKNAEACNLTTQPNKCSYLDGASGDHQKSQIEKVCQLRQAHTSTIQTPVHAGLGCPCPTEQLAPPPPQSSMEYNVGKIWESTDLLDFPSYQIRSTSTMNTQCLGTAETDQGNCEQLQACLDTGAYGVNNTSLTHDNLVQQAADSLSWQIDPAFDFSNLIPTNQCAIDGEWNLDMQQEFNSSSANDLVDLEDCLAKKLTSPSNQKLVNDSSANNPVTRKLIAACYVTKAAITFMISAQQGPTSPKKKRKLQ